MEEKFEFPPPKTYDFVIVMVSSDPKSLFFLHRGVAIVLSISLSPEGSQEKDEICLRMVPLCNVPTYAPPGKVEVALIHLKR